MKQFSPVVLQLLWAETQPSALIPAGWCQVLTSPRVLQALCPYGFALP